MVPFVCVVPAASLHHSAMTTHTPRLVRLPRTWHMPTLLHLLRRAWLCYTGSMDGGIRAWDVRESGPRACLKIFKAASAAAMPQILNPNPAMEGRVVTLQALAAGSSMCSETLLSIDSSGRIRIWTCEWQADDLTRAPECFGLASFRERELAHMGSSQHTGDSSVRERTKRAMHIQARTVMNEGMSAAPVEHTDLPGLAVSPPAHGAMVPAVVSIAPGNSAVALHTVFRAAFEQASYANAQTMPEEPLPKHVVLPQLDHCLCFTPHQSSFKAYGSDLTRENSVVVRALGSGQVIGQLAGHGGPVRFVLHAGSGLLLTAALDGMVLAWQAQTTLLASSDALEP